MSNINSNKIDLFLFQFVDAKNEPIPEWNTECFELVSSFLRNLPMKDDIIDFSISLYEDQLEEMFEDFQTYRFTVIRRELSVPFDEQYSFVWTIFLKAFLEN